MSILPIGTIVYLKEGSQKLMILNRGVTIDQNGESVLFDYSAAFYPIGLNPEQLFYFNREDVDKLYILVIAMKKRSDLLKSINVGLMRTRRLLKKV